MGGMAFAIALKRQWGFEDFVIYERASEVGGTWRDNQYPGCASDVPVHWYSFSTDLKLNWERPYGFRSDIQSYLVDVAAKYSLHAKLWRILVEDAVTKERREVHAKVLISAIGLFFELNMPKLQGLREFKGELFHSSRWRHDLDLRGKRVAVIGNGCSAIQFVPIISADSTVKVMNFARTPMWFVPRSSNAKYSACAQWAFKKLPLIARLYRAIIMFSFEIRFIVWHGRNSFFNKLTARLMTWYIKRTAPKEYHDSLIPSYRAWYFSSLMIDTSTSIPAALAPGCKRVIVDHNYLNALHRPNLTLSWDAIDGITQTGIVTSKGEIPFDVIICATGFVTDKYPIPIRGRTGQTVEEYWASQGCPTAYLGTTLPGFPNFIMIAGPNAASGHASLTFLEETQVKYALKVIKPVIDNQFASVEPTVHASESYNGHIQRRLAESVFTQCSSWYRVGSGGKIFSMWPGPVTTFWWWTRKVRWSDYLVSRNRTGVPAS
ncbi:hypothetical protein EW146_g3719 [Bondarzewia mesenterica]|uniref:Uncharacterized protein n=1 Tax=Bondarzewia mesenterica TaxID=1095465 RepID=A0A4S4LWX7_9AGAM|nr:hypothetical protein EW146_g3719 [Bondarzewia mesenterica]